MGSYNRTIGPSTFSKASAGHGHFSRGFGGTSPGLIATALEACVGASREGCYPGCFYRMPWFGSTRTPRWNERGNGFFRCQGWCAARTLIRVREGRPL